MAGVAQKALARRPLVHILHSKHLCCCRYAFCPNLTIIDTPGFILKVSFGQAIAYKDMGRSRLSLHTICGASGWKLVHCSAK